ncbi:hypothetical protein BN8_02802 [Fibrisoma limi BUZ 3]|uniref:Uncharacterized protein n=1 Tax=Fibrisoma limi BUZ 3 TaxID=1185876 RepID=I2GIG3_9BACT|nr:hypothetical protein BN8_02802 [Fibrisoma limi BUZ 3]
MYKNYVGKATKNYECKVSVIRQTNNFTVIGRQVTGRKIPPSWVRPD